ncbi:hypothetical protein HN873_067863 [Arachis hypogaea]
MNLLPPFISRCYHSSPRCRSSPCRTSSLFVAGAYFTAVVHLLAASHPFATASTTVSLLSRGFYDLDLTLIRRENMLLDDTCPCNLVSQLCSMAIRLQDSNNLAFAECKEDQSNILDVIKSNQLEKQLIEVKQFCQSSGNNSIKARSLEEEAQAQLDLQLAQETAYANFARDLSNEEQAKVTESVGSKRDLPLEEMASSKAKQAPEEVKAKVLDKQEQLCELSRASLVSREREEFLRLVKKEFRS